jgi:hypothetical protein
MRRLTAVVLLILGAMLLSNPDALAGTWLTAEQDLDGSMLVKVKSEKQKQKDLNKACGAGKVFVEGRCVKRENAEKRQEKANPKPAPTPPPKKMFCKVFPAGGTGVALGCAGGHETCSLLANGDTRCCCP